MDRAIYILTLYLFQHQFSLTSKEKNSVKELALFVSLVYVRFWHKEWSAFYKGATEWDAASGIGYELSKQNNYADSQKYT